jgi:hypothetical protein
LYQVGRFSTSEPREQDKIAHGFGMAYSEGSIETSTLIGLGRFLAMTAIVCLVFDANRDR